MGGTLYQGLVVHADGRFVADLEMGGGVVRALRMARSDAAEAAGWRDLTGKLVFPGPVVLCRSGMPLAGRGGCPATTVGVPVASRSARAAPPGHAVAATDAVFAVDAVPIPLLRGLEPELEVLPEAVFGQGCAAFAVDDRILTEPGWDDDLVRVTGHCGATLLVLSDDARVMERSVGGLPLPLDGGRVVLAPSDAAGMRAALATALRSGEPGSGIAVAVPAHRDQRAWFAAHLRRSPGNLSWLARVAASGPRSAIVQALAIVETVTVEPTLKAPSIADTCSYRGVRGCR